LFFIVFLLFFYCFFFGVLFLKQIWCLGVIVFYCFYKEIFIVFSMNTTFHLIWRGGERPKKSIKKNFSKK